VQFISTGIHCDIIGVMTDSVKRNVICYIKHTSFFSYSSLVDSDQVNAIIDQQIQVVRYVCIVENENARILQIMNPSLVSLWTQISWLLPKRGKS
jgi:hypothetical protein